MVFSNQNNPYDSLSELISSLKIELFAFNKILDRENNILNTRNFDELATLTEKKKIYISKVADLYRQISHFFTKDRQSQSGNIKNFIENLSENDKLKILWKEQNQYLINCHNINQKNQQLVSKNIQDIHKIINIIEHETAISSITYDADGINPKNNNIVTLKTKA